MRYVPNEGAGGNTAYLDADDGNTYFYAHFSQFVGGPVGVTGRDHRPHRHDRQRDAPHLHFEIRLGGVNGGTIDPYPTLKAAGC